MYQVCFYHDALGQFNANIPEREFDFIEYLEKCNYFSVSLYDTKVTEKEYDGVKFCSKREFLCWLKDCIRPESNVDMAKWYDEALAEFRENLRIENHVIDILYDEFFTGCETEKCYKKIKYLVYDYCRDYSMPTKKQIRRCTKRALADSVCAS